MTPLEIILLVFFLLCLLALLHTYLSYPIWVRFLARHAPANLPPRFAKDDPALPYVSVVMSLFNEEKVIQRKMESLLQQSYPEHKLSFWIGSDASSDQTNAIVAQWSENRPNIHFFPFPDRNGKPEVVNQLVRKATQHRAVGPSHLFLITDANVVLTSDVIYHLAKHFKDPQLAIADAHMVHVGMQEQGISKSEDQYINREVRLKHYESVAWRKMIGPFGGCYLLRSDYYHPVPPTFLVDDFYITLQVFRKDGNTINDLDAICYEAVSHEMKEEYRRKKRISAGNYQNMVSFPDLWWPPLGLPNFAYFSHKILRWLGPFFLLGMLISSGLLALLGNLFFGYLFLLAITGLPMVYVLDRILLQWQIHWLTLRHLRYFLTMNFALLHGFIQYLNGIQSNVWQPPKRH